MATTTLPTLRALELPLTMASYGIRWETIAEIVKQYFSSEGVSKVRDDDDVDFGKSINIFVFQKENIFASKWRKSWKRNRNDWISKASTRHTRHQKKSTERRKEIWERTGIPEYIVSLRT
jgi:hypothetical protein